MKKALIAGGFTATLLAGAALAGDHAEKFAAMDTDADGIVTEAEFTAYALAGGETTAEEASAKFVVLAGSDGELTLAEMTAAMEVQKDSEDWSASKTADEDGETADPGTTAEMNMAAEDGSEG